MSYFEVFAHGKSFDPDAYLESSVLAFDRKWRKGQHGSNHPLSSGVSRFLGDGSVLTLDEQERIAVEFLSTNREALKHLASYPGIETFILGLELHMGGYDNITFGPSPMLMWHALDVGIRLGFYVQFEERNGDRPKYALDD